MVKYKKKKIKQLQQTKQVILKTIRIKEKRLKTDKDRYRLLTSPKLAKKHAQKFKKLQLFHVVRLVVILL